MISRLQFELYHFRLLWRRRAAGCEGKRVWIAVESAVTVLDFLMCLPFIVVPNK